MSGTRFEVGPGGVRLGRSSSNDVHIPDEELSRNHCLFEQSGEAGIRITDLASANGTFVNGEQLGSDSRELKGGDTIEEFADYAVDKMNIVLENSQLLDKFCYRLAGLRPPPPA